MGPLERVRQPEYTGENRCLPCTVVNALLAVALAATVGAAAAAVAGATAAAAAAGVVLAGSAAAIWLRGYLVPGTPTLTKRYMPPWLLAWFGKEPAGGPVSTGRDDPDLEAEADDVETTLRAVDVLEPQPEGEDLQLTPSFRTDLEAAFEDVAEDPDPAALVRALGLDAEGVSLKEYDDAAVVTRDGRRVGGWPSTTALRVDAAAADLLAERVPDWSERSPRQRSELLAAVRLFLETCPDGSEVEASAETVESCCSSREVLTVVCAGNGDRLLEEPIR